MKNRLLIILVVAAIFPINVFAWQGMPTPMLHVEGRYLKNPNGENVTGLVAREGGIAIRQIGPIRMMLRAC
ncbi:MAG: hypothetical protein P8045_08010 [Candidatus Thiodiazotropha sp.]